RSMVADGANTPREKVFRPFLSCTTQWSPAAFTRRVRAASPGGRRIHPSGAVRIVPSAARTVFGLGPGVKVTADLRKRPCVTASQHSPAPALGGVHFGVAIPGPFDGWLAIPRGPAAIHVALDVAKVKITPASVVELNVRLGLLINKIVLPGQHRNDAPAAREG